MPRILALLFVAAGLALALPPSNNASRLRGRNVCADAPADTNALAWNAASNCWKPAAVASLKEINASLCNGVNCAAADATSVPRGITLATAGAIQKCYIWAGTAPTGATMIVDIKHNGTSIFTGTKLVLAISGTSATTATFGGNVTLAEGDTMGFVVDQVGSTITGKDVYLSCTVR